MFWFFLTLLHVFVFLSVEAIVDGERSQLIKVATLSLYDLSDAKDSAPSLGSLVFSECFLDSAISVTSGKN
jgi:hypothetical protein